MRTKRFVYNSVASALLNVLTLSFGLILPRMYLQTYGSEVNGLVSSVVQMVSYFNYVEAGLGMALIYALFKPLAERDTAQINGIVSLGRRSYLWASGLYFYLVVCLSLVYPYLIRSEGVDLVTIRALVLVIGLCGSLDFFTMAKYQVLLMADQKEYVISLASILALFLNFSLTVLLISQNQSIVLVRLVPLMSFVLRSGALFFYIKKNYPYIRYGQPTDALPLKRRWDALILQLSVSLNFSVPVVVISLFCSLKLVSVYSIYSMVFSGLIGIISVFTSGVSASFGNLVAQGEFAVLKKVQAQFEYSIYGITAFLYSCALILIDPFIKVYTKGITDINYVHPIYGVLLVVWGIMHNVRIPYMALVNSAGLYRETRRVNLAQVALLIALSLVLVQFWQITGVIVAMIIAALYRGVDLILVVRGLLIRESPFPTFVRILRMYVTVELAWLPFMLWIHIRADTLSEWLVWAMVVALWCGGLTLIVNYLLEKNLFLETLYRFKAILPKGMRTAEGG